MISVEATKSGYECDTRLPLNRQRLFERQCLDCVSHSYLIPILTSQRSKLNTKTCKFFTFYCFSCHILSIQKLTCGGQLIFSYFLSWNNFESSSLATQKLLRIKNILKIIWNWLLWNSEVPFRFWSSIFDLVRLIVSQRSLLSEGQVWKESKTPNRWLWK